jgi:hypothetical protein
MRRCTSFRSNLAPLNQEEARKSGYVIFAAIGYFAGIFLVNLPEGCIVVSLRSDPGQQKVLHRPDASGRFFRRLGIVEPSPANFSFLGVKTTGSSAWLTWTRVGSDTRYLVFSQDMYGVYFTKKNQFRLAGLEPGKTYHVFVIAMKLGPEFIAFTEFETSPPISPGRR